MLIEYDMDPDKSGLNLGSTSANYHKAQSPGLEITSYRLLKPQASQELLPGPVQTPLTYLGPTWTQAPDTAPALALARTWSVQTEGLSPAQAQAGTWYAPAPAPWAPAPASTTLTYPAPAPWAPAQASTTLTYPAPAPWAPPRTSDLVYSAPVIPATITWAPPPPQAQAVTWVTPASTWNPSPAHQPPPQYQPVTFSDFTKPQTIRNNQGFTYQWHQQSDGKYEDESLSLDLREVQSVFDLRARDEALKQANRLKHENTKLTTNAERQLTQIQSLKRELSQAYIKNQRLLTQNELNLREYNRKLKNATVLTDIDAQLAQAAETRAARAAAENERVARVAAENERARAEAETRARAAEARVGQLQRQTHTAEAQLADEIQARAAQAAETERARADAALQAQLAAEAKLAVEIQARAAAEVRVTELEGEINQKDKMISKLQQSVASLTGGLQSAIKYLTNLNSAAVENNNSNKTITYIENEKTHVLTWNYDQDKFKRELELDSRFNMFSKMAAFKDSKNPDSESQKQNEQRDITFITLLKLKIIALGMHNGSDFEKSSSNINGYLEGLGIKSGNELCDNDSKSFCQEYLKLGDQYKKILGDSDYKDALEKMMSDYFKKETLPLRNKNALAYKKLEPHKFADKIKEVSGFDFSTNDEHQKDQIKFLSTFEIALKDACSGYEEIKKQTSTSPAGSAEGQEFKITPEIAKVFIVLDEQSQRDFLAKIGYNQIEKLRGLVDNELNLWLREKNDFEVKNPKDIPLNFAEKFISRLFWGQEKKDKAKDLVDVRNQKDNFSEKIQECNDALDKLDIKIEESRVINPSLVQQALSGAQSSLSVFITNLNSIILGQQQEEVHPQPNNSSDIQRIIGDEGSKLIFPVRLPPDRNVSIPVDDSLVGNVSAAASFETAASVESYRGLVPSYNSIIQTGALPTPILQPAAERGVA